MIKNYQHDKRKWLYTNVHFDVICLIVVNGHYTEASTMKTLLTDLCTPWCEKLDGSEWTETITISLCRTDYMLSCLCDKL